MDRNSLVTAMQELSNKRAFFHSEADFQFSLAWKIKELNNDSDIRIEYRCDGVGRLDILVICGRELYPIEVKYKTRGIPHPVGDEQFNLKSHGAQDIGRYLYVKDIDRVEKFSRAIHPMGDFVKGFAIMLTNDHVYYDKNSSSHRNNNYTSFLIDDEATALKGSLEWNKPNKKTSNKYPQITLRGEYKMRWEDYGSIGENNTYQEGYKFRYLITEIREI